MKCIFMSKVIILGGCGVVGTAAAKILAQAKEFDEVVIGDLNIERATVLAADLGSKVSAILVDASDKTSLQKAIVGCSVVVNTVGPYYKFLTPILSTVIEAGINYVDVCDDTGATYEALEMTEAAKKAGVTALIGMGSSPGVTNLLAAYAATVLLEECDSIDMYHIHGGEPTEGPGVIGHRFYCLSNPIPVFLDGKSQTVSQVDSASLEEEVEFINLEGKYRVYPYPHPEPITMPMFVKGLKRVTNKGSVMPSKYYALTRKIHEAGLSSKEPLMVKGHEVVPYDFAIAYLIEQRDKILAEENFGDQRGCVKIVCKGLKKETREPRTYIFSLVSEGAGKNQALGEATGIPAAFGAMLMQKGKIPKKGVYPPEGCVQIFDFLAIMQKTLKTNKTDKNKKSPIIFQSIDAEGNVKQMEF